MTLASPDVSVVVPVYNVEAYLRQCVDSILAQTHRNIEVILVNDGSTDTSLEILREYEAADGRVKVIDKPNGGYGHSVNRGIEAATGTWLSIIEPDDIIDVRMYADLLANARLSDGTLADVVKSSYWLYYDLEDGSEPYTAAPNLMTYMPRERQVLNKAGLRELLFHHPSIWSAIYRRDFIEANGIRMIEPKGAGWADNPWFFDTMLRAKSIVWWPQAYYLYRQTNPNASSKSPAKELPFDRLRDMRAIVKELGAESRDEVMVPLYNRSFCYILDSVLDEYGYREDDPELQSLIHETLESMDRETVLGATFGIPESHKSYYKDIMGIHLDQLEHVDAADSPTLSIVLAMDNDGQELWTTILSLTSQDFRDFEVLCVDTGSHNRFARIVADVSKVDARFSLVQLGEQASVADAFNAGLAAARGEYVQFWRPGVTYPYRTDLAHIFTQSARRDICLASKPAQAAAAGEEQVPFSQCSRQGDAIVTTERTLGSVVPQGLAPYPAAKAATLAPDGRRAAFVCAGRARAYGMLFLRALLLQRNLAFGEADSSATAFALQAIDKAEAVTLVRGGSPDTARADVIEDKRLAASEDLASLFTGRIALLKEQTDALAEPGAGFGALLLQFTRALDAVLSPDGGQELFEAVSALFRSCFDGADLSGLTIAQHEQYARLRGAFGSAYAAMLETEVGRLRANPAAQGNSRRLEKELARATKHLTSIRNSASYRLGRTLTYPLRTLAPAELSHKLRARFRRS